MLDSEGDKAGWSADSTAELHGTWYSIKSLEKISCATQLQSLVDSYLAVSKDKPPS